jgi:hypothetical protein
MRHTGSGGYGYVRSVETAVDLPEVLVREAEGAGFLPPNGR